MFRMALFYAPNDAISRGKTVIMNLNLKYLRFRQGYAMSILRFDTYYLRYQSGQRSRLLEI